MDFEAKSGIVACATEWGRWYQTVSDVTVEVALEEGTRAKEVSVVLAPSSLACTVRGKTLFTGSPFDTIVEDESTWTIEDRRTLRIQLCKCKRGQPWRSLLKDVRFEADDLTFHEMRKKLDLEQFQIENPGMDFSGAKLDKRYEDTFARSLESKKE